MSSHWGSSEITAFSGRALRKTKSGHPRVSHFSASPALDITPRGRARYHHRDDHCRSVAVRRHPEPRAPGGGAQPRGAFPRFMCPHQTSDSALDTTNVHPRPVSTSSAPPEAQMDFTCDARIVDARWNVTYVVDMSSARHILEVRASVRFRSLVSSATVARRALSPPSLGLPPPSLTEPSPHSVAGRELREDDVRGG